MDNILNCSNVEHMSYMFYETIFNTNLNNFYL